MRLLPFTTTLLLVIPALAAEPVNLTRGTCDALEPVWSADSREIYYYSACNPATNPGWQMQVMSADGSDKRVISSRGDFRPRPSPDGKRIAFDSFRDGNNHEVYVSDRDGGNAVRLTNHAGYDVSPSWSPDGEWLVFSSGEHPVDNARPHWYGESDLWLIRRDGTERRRLTSEPGDDVYPFWSPDGKWIAFTSWRDGNPEAYLVSADGKEQRRLTHSIAAEHNPRLSPDGRYVAYSSDRTGDLEVWVANLDGSDATNVTAHPAHDGDAAWSPDGKWFLFTSKRGGNWNIYRVPASHAVPRARPKPEPVRREAAPVNVTSHGGADAFGAISPDGRTVVFQSDRDPTAPYRDSALYALSLDTGELVALPHGFADARPSWSPTGKEIVFESERDGDVDLYVLELFGKSVRKLFDEPGAQTAARWSPDGSRVAYASGADVWLYSGEGTGKRNLTGHTAVDGAPSWAPDGKRLAFVSNRDGNFELYTLDLQSGAATRLTDNQVPDTAPAWSPDGRHIAYTTVVDGASEVMLLDLREGTSRNVSNHAAWDHQPAWSSDGCGLLFTSKRSGDLDLWLVDTCDAAAE